MAASSPNRRSPCSSTKSSNSSLDEVERVRPLGMARELRALPGASGWRTSAGAAGRAAPRAARSRPACGAGSSSAVQRGDAGLELEQRLLEIKRVRHARRPRPRRPAGLELVTSSLVASTATPRARTHDLVAGQQQMQEHRDHARVLLADARSASSVVLGPAARPARGRGRPTARRRCARADRRRRPATARAGARPRPAPPAPCRCRPPGRAR